MCLYTYTNISNKYVNVQIEDVIYLKDNLEALINLLTAQESSNISYKKLLDSVLFLLLAEKKDITINNEIVYKYAIDSFLHNIKNATKISFENNENLIQTAREDCGKDIVYRVKDSISINGYHEINISNFESFLEDEEPGFEFVKQIFKAYLIKDSSVFFNDEKLVIEFLFHFVQQISLINLESISLDTPFSKEVYNKLESREFVTLREALFKISKFLIERELNYHLSQIRPIYNAETMQPNWNLPSLLSAMYLSLFYLDSRQATYRACQNINCGQSFLVSKTNLIKKYCCIYCTNAVSQRRYKHKKGE